jgi:hypothetical protein
MTATEYGTIFDVEVLFGDEIFYIEVDTGSSDTWVVQTGFTCINRTDNSVLLEAQCNYGSAYNINSSFHQIQNQTFGVKYGTGIATGVVGYEKVTLAGITIDNQIVGVGQSVTDVGDGLRSGILGLAYPALTSAHPGRNYPNDTISLITNRIVYNPLLNNMYDQGLSSEPWFSVALERLPANVSTGAGGYFGVAELPPVEHSSEWTVAPVEITKSIPDSFYPNGIPELTLWTLTVSSVSWSPAAGTGKCKSGVTTNSTAFQASVDTGNPFLQLPVEITAAINAVYDPPAVLDENSGHYIVDCDARAPKVSLTIANATFWLDERDMITQVSPGQCISSVVPIAESIGISLSFLGDAFLRNVVAVFDFGKDEMRFSARAHNSV